MNLKIINYINSYVKMKFKIKKHIGILVLVTIVILFVDYLKNHIKDFQQLSLVNPIYILILAIIFIFYLSLNGILLKTLMEPFNIKLKNLEAFGLSTITNFYNYITPFRGGAGVRAIYLKKKHNFSYVHFFATLSAIYILIFLIGSLGGLISMGYIWLNYGIFDYLIFSVFLIFFLFLLLIIFFSPKLSKRKNKWINKVIEIINGWQLIKSNKKIIITTLIISSLQLVLMSMNFWIAYRSFGIEIEFFKALFIASINSLSMLLAITPGNLGIGDAINVFSAGLVGIGVAGAIGATVLRRGVTLLVIFIMGPIFSYILLKHNPNKQKNEHEKK